MTDTPAVLPVPTQTAPYGVAAQADGACSYCACSHSDKQPVYDGSHKNLP